MAAEFALLYHTQFATYNNQWLAYKLDRPAAFWLEMQRSETVNEEINKSGKLQCSAASQAYAILLLEGEYVLSLFP